jgi:hypothetical protein
MQVVVSLGKRHARNSACLYYSHYANPSITKRANSSVCLSCTSCCDLFLPSHSAAWQQFIATYAGNPLALKIVGQAIVDLFAGDTEAFLQSGELIFNGIRAVLRQQVMRLTLLEQTLLTWLAVVRNWTSFETLLSLQMPRVARTGTGGLGSTLTTIPAGAGTTGQLYAAISGDGVPHRCSARPVD